MKRIGLLIFLIIAVPGLLNAVELTTPRMHLGLVAGGGLSYIGTLGETPRWEPEGLGYFAPTVTYYTPNGLAIRGEIAKLTRSSTMQDDSYYYQFRKISSSTIHTPVTVLFPISRENSLNNFYFGTGLYLDTLIEAKLYAEHNSDQVFRQSIRNEFETVGYGVSVQLGLGLSSTFYMELRYLMDLSEFSAASISEHNLQTQSLMLRLGMDLTKFNLHQPSSSER